MAAETPISGTMNGLVYWYQESTNRLRQIQEFVSTPSASTTRELQLYIYDAIGNLIGDAAEGITNVEWSMYGKVLAVWKNGVKTLEFLYDGAGRRVRGRWTPAILRRSVTT